MNRLFVVLTVMVGLTGFVSPTRAQARPDQKDLDTALLHAVENDEFGKAKLLIFQGASVNAPNADLLIITAHVAGLRYDNRAPHPRIIFKMLLAHHARINTADATGRTPLMAFSFEGDLEAVKILVERGAKVNVQDQDGVTALMMAIFANEIGDPRSYPQIVKYLLSRGARVNEKDAGGYTALMKAAQLDTSQEFQNAVTIAKMLIALGANVNTRNLNGDTALQLARRSENSALVQFLLKHGAHY